MKVDIESALELQSTYTSKNTEGMAERGRIIRNAMPDWLRENAKGVFEITSREGRTLSVDGSDGIGLKSEVPWVRVYSAEHSPNARNGWYVVYLFAADGSAVYLSLGFGSTVMGPDGSLRAKDDGELAKVRSWGQDLLRGDLESNPRLVESIALHARTKVGQSYEKAVAVAIPYFRNSVPEGMQLVEDLEVMARLLHFVYDRDDVGATPTSEQLEVIEVERVARPLSRSSRSGSQGIGLTAEQRRAVELRAMVVAKSRLEADGYTVKDCSATHPYDYLATKNGDEFVVEVKGTTGLGSKIILTRNEVAIHRERYPSNFLIVVSEIELVESKSDSQAIGGVLHVVKDWKIEDRDLHALTFQYEVPST